MDTRSLLLRIAQLCFGLLLVDTALAGSDRATPQDQDFDLREPILVRLDGGLQLQLAQGWSSIEQSPRSDKCVIGSYGSEPVTRWTESLEFSFENRSSSSSSGRASQASLGVAYKGFTLGLSGSNSSSNYSASTALNEQAKATMHFIHSVDRVERIAPNPPLMTKLKDGTVVSMTTPTVYLAPNYLPIQSDWVQFHKRCGDRYVSAIIRGAEMNVILNRTFSSFEQRRCWTRSRGGSFGFAKIISLSGGSASQECNAKGGANEKLEMYSNEHGTGKDRILVVDLDTLKKNAESYPTRASANTTALWAVLTPYSDVTGFVSDMRFGAALRRSEQLKAAYGRFMYVAATAREAATEQSDGSPKTNQYLSRSLIGGTAEPLGEVEFAALRYARAIDEELSRIRECVKGKELSCPVEETEAYDDYPLRILLPLPTSKLTADVVTYLGDAVPLGETVETYNISRRNLYAAIIERVVIENSLRDRCEILSDCSDAASYKDLANQYRDLILATLQARKNASPVAPPASVEAGTGLYEVWTTDGKSKVNAISAWFVEPIDQTVNNSRCRRGSLHKVYEIPSTAPPKVLSKCPAMLSLPQDRLQGRFSPLMKDLDPDKESNDKITSMVSKLEI